MADIPATTAHTAAAEHGHGATVHHDTAGHHGGPRAHQFDTAEQQFAASQLGMWTFLATEVLTFGGLFLAYIVYRTLYPNEFHTASTHQNVTIGAVNTLVLIASSCTMALGVWASQVGNRKLLMIMLAATIGFAGIFMVNKGFEYAEHWNENLVPGARYHFVEEHGEAAEPGTGEGELGNQQISAGNAALDSDAQLQGRTQLFFLLYFIMTGLHGFHVLIGMVILGVLLYQAYRHKFTPDYYTPVEVTGLYWHFVDLVWIFLFPLLYLIGGFDIGGIF